MSKATLVVMAAGIGSRFGGGIKQLEPVGPNGEIIMDYSIYDAMEADLIKWYLLFEKIWKRIFVKLSETGLKRKLKLHMHSRKLMIFRKHLKKNLQKERNHGNRSGNSLL